MSLTALPVSVSDLENLQLGIIRVSNPTEATQEALLINSGGATVFSYAQELLAQAAHSSEVVDGVISAIDLITPTAAQFNNLVLNFLPAQIAFANAQHLNQTVYAAETVGLGVLTNDAFFIAHYGPAAFANSVAGDQLAAQAIVNAVFGAAATSNLNNVATQEISFWKGFYTAHPTATGLPSPTADQIDTAARATAAGEMVGVAIDGNIGTLKSVADNVLIGDGLHLNGQGPNVLAVAEPGSVPATVLQGQPSQTFLLTIGQDTFHGSGPADVFNAPLAGIFGNQPTLTAFDSLTESGTGALLNASFNGTPFVQPNGVTIDGIATWNIQNVGGGEVDINGGPGNVIRGLRTLNYNDNGSGGSLAVGTLAFPILPAAGSTFDGFSLNVANAVGGGFVDVAMVATGFSAGNTIHVIANSVGADGSAYDIAAGSPTAGFATWDVHSLNAGAGNTNNIGLGADGSTAARTVVLTDDHSNTTLWAASASGSTAADWSKVTSIDLSHTSGFVTLTGLEQGAGSDGFLSANNAITQILGGTGSSFYDLTSLSAATAHAATQIQGGSGGNSEVAFNNGVLTGGLSVNLQNISILDDASNTQGGTINMANFPLTPTTTSFSLPAGGAVMAGFDVLQFLAADGDITTSLGSNLVIANTPTNFAVNMQDMSFNAHNITITAGPVINTADTLKLWVSDESFVPTFTINNYTTTDIFLPTEGSSVELGLTAFIDQPVISVTNASLNILGGDDLFLGHTFSFDSSVVFGDIGFASVILDATGATTINDVGAGRLIIGATDVTNLNAQSTSHLVMDIAASGGGVAGTSFNAENIFLHHGITVNGSTQPGGSNLLQGSSGPLTLDTLGNGFLGGIANDTITGGIGGDNIFGEGGNDTINLGAAGHTDHVWIAMYSWSHTAPAIVTNTAVQAISDIVGGGELEVNFYLGALSNVTTVTGFTLGALGAGGDVLNFNPSSWAFGPLSGGVFDFGLQHAGGGVVPHGIDATLQLLTATGAIPFLSPDVILDGLSTYANAVALNTALHTLGVGDINLQDSGLVINNVVQHQLVAYSTGSGVNIADVELVNTSGVTQVADTANVNLFVNAIDLVHLTGTTALGDLVGANIHFI